MFNAQHFGLYFTPLHVEQARKYRQRPPFEAAYAALRQLNGVGARAAQAAGLQWRFAEDERSARMAVAGLDYACSVDLTHQVRPFDGIQELIIYAQAFEMVRDYWEFSADLQQLWLQWFSQQSSFLLSNTQSSGYVEDRWRLLLLAVVGIVLEQESSVIAASDELRRVVAEDISPRGHLERAIAPAEGSAIQRSVQAVSALVLTTEALSHVGLNLWDYHVRGVSVMTAAIYPMYYFYVTDKWLWEPTSPEEVQAAYRTYGGYLEIIHRRMLSKDFKPLLEDLRPLYDPTAGGLTTLTHGVPIKRGLFG